MTREIAAAMRSALCPAVHSVTGVYVWQRTASSFAHCISLHNCVVFADWQRLLELYTRAVSSASPFLSISVCILVLSCEL
jgi:hypothetical protein